MGAPPQPSPGPSRRHVVLGLGGGGLALALVSACSSSSSSPSSSPSVTVTSHGDGPPTPATPSVAEAAGGLAGAPGWDRVDLGFVSAYVLVRGAEAAVVDTGTAGSADAIGAVLDAAGPGWAGVRHVVLTHHHPDHAGSLPDVLQRATSAKGYIGAADLDQVRSPRPLVALDDGAEVFGLRMVATPGHTAGHMSAFDPRTGVLVTGDALTNTNGLAGSNPQFTADPAAAKASVRALAGLAVTTLLFGHGEPLQDASPALKKLAGL